MPDSRPPSAGPDVAEILYFLLLLGVLVAVAVSFVTVERRRAQESPRETQEPSPDIADLIPAMEPHRTASDAPRASATRAAREAAEAPPQEPAVDRAPDKPRKTAGAGEAVATPPHGGTQPRIGLAGTPSEAQASSAVGASRSPNSSQPPGGSAGPARAVSEGRRISGAGIAGQRPSSPHAATPVPAAAAGADGRGVFVPARTGLGYHARGADVWTQWPDGNRRNIFGGADAARLNAAFDIAARSRASAITDDLYRKGVAIAFGEPSEFSGETHHAIALLQFPPGTSPPGAPETPPVIKFNPVFLDADPLVLAGALVHEGTHLQQYLDGTLLDPDAPPLDTECAAWWNEAAFWDEVRGQAWPFDTVLELEAEFAYRAALHGEAMLKDVLAALHQH